MKLWRIVRDFDHHAQRSLPQVSSNIHAYDNSQFTGVTSCHFRFTKSCLWKWITCGRKPLSQVQKPSVRKDYLLKDLIEFICHWGFWRPTFRAFKMVTRLISGMLKAYAGKRGIGERQYAILNFWAMILCARGDQRARQIKVFVLEWILQNQGCLPFDRKCRKFRKEGKW